METRTNIVVSDRLMRQAMQASGLCTKRAVLEAGLDLLIKLKGQAGIHRLRGKVAWRRFGHDLTHQ
jgi:Arc/MetJ family transcription regulator